MNNENEEYKEMNSTLYLKFHSLIEVVDAKEFNLKINTYYEIVGFTTNGEPTLLLPTGDVFILGSEELTFAEMIDGDFLDDDLNELTYDELSYEEFNSYNKVTAHQTKESKLDKYIKNEYLDDVSVNVDEKEVELLIEQLEELYKQNEIDRLLDLKDFTALSKLQGKNVK